MRVSVCLVLGTLLFGFDRPQAAPPAIPGLPPNIVVDSRLAGVMAETLRASPTLREQCAHLARVRALRVTIVLDLGTPVTWRSTQQAEGALERYEYGRIEARIRLWSMERAAHVIGHELEHVREFAEGIQYAALSARRLGVWRTPSGHYETARAIAAGRQVGVEASRYRDKPLSMAHEQGFR